MLFKKVCLFVMVCTVSTMFVGMAQATVVTIDDGDAGFSTAGIGTWGGWTGSCVNGDYLYYGVAYPYPFSTGADASTATYAPSIATAGQYAVYASWTASSAHSPVAGYIVNFVGGATMVNINQQLNAAQGNVGSIVSPNGNGSGYAYLGTFSLDSTSSVVLGATDWNTSPIIADAVMFRSADAGRYIDPLSNSVTVSRNADGIAGVTGSPSGNYAYWMGSSVSATYNPEVSAAGKYDIQMSWGYAPNHTSDAQYLIDLNGNGIQDVGEDLIHVNQALLADGSGNGGLFGWSDYLDLGTYDLTTASRVCLLWDGTGTAVSASSMLVTMVPEPSTLALLASGLMGLLCYAWRKRKCVPS